MAELKLPEGGELGSRRCNCDNITPEMVEDLIFGLAVAEEGGKIILITIF